jgi:hypothetical protein
MSPDKLPPHIPIGAEEKTAEIMEIAPYFKNWTPAIRFFRYEGKAYSMKPDSLYNEMDWQDFCNDLQFMGTWKNS